MAKSSAHSTDRVRSFAGWMGSPDVADLRIGREFPAAFPKEDRIARRAIAFFLPEYDGGLDRGAALISRRAALCGLETMQTIAAKRRTGTN
jgi:hypothetical protein